MAWTIRYEKKALSFLKKCDKKEARRIVDFLDQHVAPLEDVRVIGKPLKGQFPGLWRYRVGDYRILCELVGVEILFLELQGL
ncbi:type II toxin-antitoxin system RelE family toxin [Bartonella henselae]|uniref:type II toxin-antitoxin system RelE family toxin n=1 Tax=Bartonella henselae TaxID=38323 RepID=UPI00095A7B2A|nr:type II toxin-antitoxin system RelE/ParE family toxin [Bartonella henselae]OLL50014.1 addiction module toxin RelE [Bartonella henselae]OLL50887.1 addiction module toxin RelE [Bartonella henselae]UJM43436.1 type II toxin-antitoxin system RelE/ParE family toxin [Bartonella henselae]